MKPHKKLKLSLSRDTIHHLSSSNLDKVAGGMKGTFTGGNDICCCDSVNICTASLGGDTCQFSCIGICA